MIANPDQPMTKLAAVLAGLERKGIVLPEDFTFEKPHALDVLLGAIESNLATLDAKGKSATSRPPAPDPEESSARKDSDKRRAAKAAEAESAMAFDEADRPYRPVVNHLSPEEAERVFAIGLQQSGSRRFR